MQFKNPSLEKDWDHIKTLEEPVRMCTGDSGIFIDGCKYIYYDQLNLEDDLKTLRQNINLEE